jgi:hypothetical protein
LAFLLCPAKSTNAQVHRNNGHLRLFADIECLLEQFDETEFDGDISSGSVLRLRGQPQSSVARKKGAHLDDLEYVGIDSDSQVLSGNWWVWRHSDALQLTMLADQLDPGREGRGELLL